MTFILENLTGSCDGGQTAFGPLNFALAPGDVFAFLPGQAFVPGLERIIAGGAGVAYRGGRMLLEGIELTQEPTWRRARLGIAHINSRLAGIPGLRAGEYLRQLHWLSHGDESDDAAFRARIEAAIAGLGLSLHELRQAMSLDTEGRTPLTWQLLEIEALAPKVIVISHADAWLKGCASQRTLLLQAMRQWREAKKILVLADPVELALLPFAADDLRSGGGGLG